MSPKKVKKIKELQSSEVQKKKRKLLFAASSAVEGVKVYSKLLFIFRKIRSAINNFKLLG